jgi:NAD(P)-dependent dehydrogenase (short-subunit alcohol dehydrogenase family)
VNLSDARHAFVTGGASGIGLAIVDALRARGVAITMADIDQEHLAAESGQRGSGVAAIVLDVRDRPGWLAAKQQAEARFGPIDILINNAGIGPDSRALADMKPESFDRVIAINLIGAFNGVSTFAGDLRARGACHIINMSSMSGGFAVGRSGCGAFAAANFGVVGLSEALREEMAPHGVGVSVLCPGLVSTNLGLTTARVGGEVINQKIPMPGSEVSAAMVADSVMDGIAGNARYITSHSTYAPIVQKRFARMRRAFEVLPADPAAGLIDPPRFRHAFVTGGASGIGLAIVDALLAQGLSVTIADVDEEALAAIAERSPRLTGIPLDVRDRAGWCAAKQTAESRFGPVNILVNNAGIGTDGRHCADVDPRSFDRMVAIDLTGVFNGISTFAADLRARGFGQIVNTASMMALAPAYPGTAAYTAAKCGVVALSEVLRSEMAPHGVGVSVLCPAFVETNLRANTIKAGSEVSATTTTGRTGLPLPIVGAYVIRGICENHPYIMTHPDTLPSFDLRTNRILAAVGVFGSPISHSGG